MIVFVSSAAIGALVVVIWLGVAHMLTCQREYWRSQMQAGLAEASEMAARSMARRTPEIIEAGPYAWQGHLVETRRQRVSLAKRQP